MALSVLESWLVCAAVVVGAPALGQTDDGGTSPSSPAVPHLSSQPDAGVTLTPAAPPAVQPAPDAPPPVETTPAVAVPPASLFQRMPLEFGIFGNVDGRVSGDGAPAFMLGGLDLFITSRPHQSLGLLAEVVFEATSEQTFVTDVERVMATWEFDPRLRVTAGRMHQALGYYNASYHHGRVLMNSIERPAVIAFEDEGGVLPVHAIGVDVGGDWEVGDLSVGYGLTLSNGRGRNPDEILNVSDLNPSKSILGALSLSHLGWGLRVGVNALYDRIPSEVDAAGVEVRPSQDELIFGAHLLLERDLVWFLAEGYLVEHVSTSRGRLRTVGFFAEGRVNIRPVYLYARYDQVDFPAQVDPFFDPSAPFPSRRSVLVGVGWRLLAGLLLKLEGDLAFPEGLPFVPTARGQLAFSF